jgi:hypothetical protein
MKRSILCVLLVLPAALLFSQTGSGRGRGIRTPPEPPEAVTVSGNLALINARIGLESGDVTYYIIGIDRLIGFVDGLIEGAPVSLEGYEFSAAPDSEYRFLRVLKLSFNGKDYEVSPGLNRLAEGSGEGRAFAPPGSGEWRPPAYPDRPRGPRHSRRNFRHHFEWR